MHLEGTVTAEPPRGAEEFYALWKSVEGRLQKPEDFQELVYGLSATAQAQNIRYLEVHVSLEPHSRHTGIPFRELLDALEEARRSQPVRMAWILDAVRCSSTGVDSGWRTLEGLPEGTGVVALGLGGRERGHPARHFAEVFAEARRRGLRCVAHAGETEGPWSIREALDVLQVDRIGHGVRALEDPALVRELAERRVPLEVCPTSNRCLGVGHPDDFHRLRHAGVRVTVNSDDPGLFGTTLTDEFRRLNLTGDEVRELTQTALEASFLPESERACLLQPS